MAARGAVSRRAVSANLNRLDSTFYDVSPDHLFTFLLKLAILTYRCEPRFRVSDSLSQGVDSIALNSHSPSHSRKGSYVGLTSRDSATSMAGLASGTVQLDKIKSSKSKLPKNIIEIVNKKLPLLFSSPTTAYTPDEISRRIFARFYTSLNGQVAETIRRSRSPFELLMIFLKEASKELQVYYAQTGELGSLDPSIYAPQFIQFLIDALTDKGFSSSHAKLLSELKSFKDASARGETLRPTMPSGPSRTNGHGSHNSISGFIGLETLPSFKLSDMTVAKYLTALFGYSEDQVQQMIDQLKGEATEAASVAELRFFRDELELNNRHPTHTRTDFSSESAFQDWKAQELHGLDQQINNLVKNKHSLSSVLPYQPTVGEPITFVFAPLDPKSFYRVLLKLCLRRDEQWATDSLLLSKESSDLLLRVGNTWRLSPVTRALVLLNVSCEFYDQGIITLQKLGSDVFGLARLLITENEKEEFNPNAWPESDKALSYFTMKSLYSALVNKITALLIGIYNDKKPEIAVYMNFLGNTLLDFAEFDGYQELDPTPEQISDIKDTIINIAEDKYQELVSEIPRDHTFSYEHVLHVADVVIDRAHRLLKRYPKPIFGKVNIAQVAIRTNLKAFSEDCNLMIQHIIATMQAQNLEFTLGEISSLYSKLIETREIYKEFLKGSFSFDIESRFEPFALQQIQVSSDMAVTWVDPIVARDGFLPPKDSDESFISTSVGDLFTSFNEIVKIVSDLNWENQIHVATFYTIMMKGISAAVCRYTEQVFSLFQKDLSQGEEKDPVPYKSRQGKWIAVARNAVNGAPVIKPYTFQETTCVKLNDIERAQTELDHIESLVDSEKQHSYLSRVIRQESKAQSFSFTVKIVEATDLRACDSNGLSDPYVTIVLDMKKKQIGRTRTVFEDLNPIWNETFELTLSEPSSLWLTVWDENAITDHSVCGRALVPLDPKAFQDFISKEEWIDLKPQGQLRVMITMESEREDIRFFFGKSLRTLMRAESDMVRLIVNKFSAFIKFSISDKTLRALTNPKSNIDKVTDWWSSKSTKPKPLGENDVANSLDALFTYLNANFSTLHLYLTPTMKVKVMTMTWEVVLDALESLLLPPLSGKPTSQTPLTIQEKDNLSIWTETLLHFFYHDGQGIPMEVLKSKQYQEFLVGLSNYYDLSTQELIKLCEEHAAMSFKKLQQRNFVSVHEQMKRSNTVMAHRNRKALREEQNKLQDAERQSPGTEDIILRILRLRGEHHYVAKRLDQRARLSKTLAAEAFLRR